MSLMFRNETEPHKYGLKIDPSDPNKAVPIAQPSDGQRGQPCVKDPHGEPVLCGAESDPRTEASSAAEAASPQSAESLARETSGGRPTDGEPDSISVAGLSHSAAQGRPDGRTGSTTERQTPQGASPDAPQSTESFARETSFGALGDVSRWDDQAFLVGMKAECAQFRVLDGNYPGRYHRLGVFNIEARKRFGEEELRQFLRQEGIDSTMAWRAEQIATLYTFDQAVAFPSLRAILKTLPARQPRGKKRQPNRTGRGDGQPDSAQQSPRTQADATETVLDRFIRFGIEVRETLGDAAFDKAVEEIRAHVAETFEEAFAEVTT